MVMVIFKDLIDIIDNNKKKLNKDSLIFLLDEKTNKMRLVKSIGHLNVEGVFSFTSSSGRVLNDKTKQGDIISIMGDIQRIELKPNYTLEKDEYVCQLTTLDNTGTRDGLMTVSKFNKTKSGYNENGELTSIGINNPDGSHGFHLIKDIKILETPSFSKWNTYGLKGEFNYKYNCIAIVVGENFTQNYIPKKESLILKFDEFKKAN